MIDNPLRTLRLMARLLENLPVEARLTPRLASYYREHLPDLKLPQHCRVTDIHYGGDEGGIMCQLDFDGNEDEAVLLASLTQIAFDRRHPLAREIAIYQKHRIKRLRTIGIYGLKPADWPWLDDEEEAA